MSTSNENRYKALSEAERAWAEYLKAQIKYANARTDIDRAGAEYAKSWDDYIKALANYDRACV